MFLYCGRFSLTMFVRLPRNKLQEVYMAAQCSKVKYIFHSKYISLFYYRHITLKIVNEDGKNFLLNNIVSWYYSICQYTKSKQMTVTETTTDLCCSVTS